MLAGQVSLAEDFFQQGRDAANRGNYDEALADFNRALRQNPSSAGVYCAIGIVYANKKMYQDAVTNLKKAIELDPDKAIAYYVLGMVYEEMSKPGEAMEAWKKFLSLRPDDKRAETAKEHLKRLGVE